MMSHNNEVSQTGRSDRLNHGKSGPVAAELNGK